jgi:hypothetical protein
MIDVTDFKKYLGLRLAMALHTIPGDIGAYWMDVDPPESVFQAPDFGGRFGMSFAKFRKINDNLRLDNFVDDLVDQVSVHAIFNSPITVNVGPLRPN